MFQQQASSNPSGPVSTLNVVNVGPQTTNVVQQKTSKAGLDIASMSCISGVKNEIAEEMKITENNLPLFGIETPHEVELSKVKYRKGYEPRTLLVAEVESERD